jgi:two-component system, NtrC family, response regulator HydG
MKKDNASILVLDDDPDILLASQVVLSKHFKEITICEDPNIMTNLLHTFNPDVILLDMNFKPGNTSGKEGLAMLQKIKKTSPSSQVIVITAYGDINLAVEAMKKGAIDFVVKPWENMKLIATVKAASNLGRSKREIEKLKTTRGILSKDIDQPFSEIIGKSEAMRNIFRTIGKVSKTDANILLLGENGTGKEVVARAIHRNSNRANDVFISVDVGAIPDSLFESELFGHEKGAFTDAKESRQGRFEVADGGTLFLDEIGNLSLALQAKLLNVLQNREFIPLGSNRTVKIDIRLICATNMPLQKMVDEQRFRQDLLYRINTVEIRLPPLRERSGDIDILAKYFLGIYSRKYHKKDLKYSPLTLAHLNKASWPGNVRELQHMVERAVIMCDKKYIDPSLFPVDLHIEEAHNNSLNLEVIERSALINAMKKHHGNITKVSGEMGLGRTTIYRKIRKYGL